MPMEDVQVTLTVLDDGSIDIKKFTDDPHLKKIKGVIDGLRSESAGYRTRANDLEPLVGENEQLKAQVAEWSGKVAMTPEEKQAFDDAKARLERFGDLDPDDAKQAVAYRTTTEADKALGKAFKTAGYNPDVALGLDGVRQLETRVETVDDKPAAQVKVGDSWRALDDSFLSERYSPFMGVLKGEATKEDKKPDGMIVLPTRSGETTPAGPKTAEDRAKEKREQGGYDSF